MASTLNTWPNFLKLAKTMAKFF